MHSDRVPGTNYCFYGHEGALPAIAVAHPAFSASILLQGAQLIRFMPKGETNWLWLSEEEPFLAGQAVRGGVPICWPWFGIPHRNPALVRQHIHTERSHGFARQSDWRLQQVQESDHAVTLALIFDSRGTSHSDWTGQAQVIAFFHFSAQALSIQLETLNNGAQPLHYSQALHSYFPTTDIRQTRIRGLNGVSYVDALRDWQTFVQKGPVGFQAETDRIYSVSAPMEIETPTRHFKLLQRNSSTTVIWNPWEGKAQRLAHFAPTAWQRMFCAETANVLDDSICTEPGESHAMGFTLSRL